MEKGAISNLRKKYPQVCSQITQEECSKISHLEEIFDKLEEALISADRTSVPVHSTDAIDVNPSLDLIAGYFVWKDPATDRCVLEKALDSDLLALKTVIERLSYSDLGCEGISLHVFIDALEKAIDKGILIGTLPGLYRDTNIFHSSFSEKGTHVRVKTFTLQWHITHACNLKCRHCYDRSKRANVSEEQGLSLLENLDSFCREYYVAGHVCFSGGNPLLSPSFFSLYKATTDRGFSTSILANATSRKNLTRIKAIQQPEYYQVSLEGLQEHNDFMRGKGNYKDVMAFLGLLKEEGISSAVMLTLTAENINQVLALANELRGVADYFTFNRLSPVGEGADLLLPAKEQYLDFLHEYITAAQSNEILGYKDNLINAVLHEKNIPLFGGCTGFGCGAAFNFICVLPDGETHACRKFPSLIGNVYENTISEIYHSKEAQRYRRGARECDGCRLRHVCGGCLAVTSGFSMDTHTRRDPFCPEYCN